MSCVLVLLRDLYGKTYNNKTKIKEKVFLTLVPNVCLHLVSLAQHLAGNYVGCTFIAAASVEHLTAHTKGRYCCRVHVFIACKGSQLLFPFSVWSNSCTIKVVHHMGISVNIRSTYPSTSLNDDFRIR
jgi:hypothetical protein